MGLSSCAFRKDTEKGNSGTDTVEHVVAKDLPTLEAVISGSDERKAIEILTERKDELKSMAQSGRETPIDLAIKYERTSILSYLLVLGHSPFVIDQRSYDKLSSNATWNSLIMAAQTDAFLDILRHYPNNQAQKIPVNRSVDSFKKTIDRYRLGAKGCERFSDYLMELNYVQEKPPLPGAYYEVVEGIDAKDVFKYVLTQTSCTKEIDKFSTSLISKWISFEIFDQLKASFSSREFLSFLVSLKKVLHVDLVVAPVRRKDFVDYRTQVVKVSPLSFLMLKKPCLKDEEFDLWFDAIEQLSAYDKESYAYPYMLPRDASNRECNTDQKYCYKSYDNLMNIKAIFHYMYPGYAIDERSFVYLFTGQKDEHIQIVNESSPGSPKMSPEDFFVEYCRDLSGKDSR